MADYPGNVSGGVISIPLPGRTAGLAYPPAGSFQPAFNIGALAVPHISVDDLQYVDEGAATTGTDDMPGHLGVETTPGIDWFEQVHLLPRGKINFGDIVTTVDERFELFSAFKRDAVTMTAVLNNALPGVVMPDFPSPPASLDPFCSFLDPTSTPHNPIKMLVRALVQGLVSFDTTIDFTFGSGVGTLYLGVMGNRIVLVAAEFVGGTRETLQWRTDVLEMKSGKEQRIADRKNPRQLIDARFHLEDLGRQQFHAMMFGWQGQVFAVAMWPEQMDVTADIAGDTTPTVQVDSTVGVDLRVGGLAAIFKNSRTFDVLTIASKTATSITFDSNILGTYSAGDRVIPVRTTHLQPALQGQQSPVNLEMFTARFRVIDNDTGAPTGDASGFSSYDGKVLLDDCNFMDGATKPGRLEQRVHVVDNETGLVMQDTPWDRHKRGHSKGFVVKTRAALWTLRRLLYALRGRQVAFWIPTFADDLTPTVALVSGQNKMTVSHMGYTRFVREREPKATFRITFTDDTSLVREITDSEVLSGTEERLTLNTTWPANRPVDEIVRVQFYELVRTDTDDIMIDHGVTVGKARVFFPVKVVFDE